MNVYRFRASIAGDVETSHESYPIYDPSGKLVGGFTVDSGDRVIGFVSGQDSEIALAVSTGKGFWFTPVVNSCDKIVSGVVEDLLRGVSLCQRHTVNSVWVDRALEEEIP